MVIINEKIVLLEFSLDTQNAYENLCLRHSDKISNDKKKANFNLLFLIFKNEDAIGIMLLN